MFNSLKPQRLAKFLRKLKSNRARNQHLYAKAVMETLEGRTLLSTATHLVFTQLPTIEPVGLTLTPSVTVAVEDQSQNIVATDNSTITLSVNSGPGSLAGTTQINASGGIATFSNLSLTALGAYTLKATDGTLTAAISSGLNITAALGSNLISQTAHTGMAYDSANGILYIPTGGTTVARYSVVTNSLLSLLTVGITVTSVAITPDNSTLYVTDTTAGATGGVVHKVNLSTSAVTDLFYPLTPLESGSWDIAMGADGKALVTTRFNGSGWNPLRSLDTTTDTFTTLSSLSSVRQSTLLADGPGDNAIFLEESNTSNGPIHYYSAASDSVTASFETNLFVGGQPAAVDRVGNLVAMIIGSNVTVMDKSLNTVKILSGVGGGVAFDPLQNILYTVDTTNNRVVAYSTDTWQVLFTVNVGEATGSASEHGNGQMLVTSDDQYLFLTTASGIRRIDLPASATTATKLAFGQQPSSATAGNTINPAVTVLVEDAKGNVVSGNSFFVTLSVSSGPGVLGGTVTVQVVNGVATFSNSFLDTAGSYTLTAVDSTLAIATSSSFTVNPAISSKLVFGQSITGATAGMAISPAVTVMVEDQFNNVVNTDSSTVTMAVSTGPGLASGTISATAVNGVATFSNLFVTAAGTYTLQATDGNLGSAFSNSFTAAAPMAPDLQINNSLYLNYNSVGQVDVHWSDLNAGNVAASMDWSDRVTVSDLTTNAVVTSVLIPYSATLSGPLNPGSSVAQAYSFVLPPGVNGSGDLLRVDVLADANNNIAEFNSQGTGETNNAAVPLSFNANSVQAPPSGADLQINNTLYVNSNSLGQVDVHWTDLNAGTSVASVNWGDLVTVADLTTNSVITSALVTYPGQTSPLFAGNSAARVYSFTLPQGIIASGDSIQVNVAADYQNNIAEYNAQGTAEKNNAAVPITFVALDTISPTATWTPPASFTWGQQTIQFTVTYRDNVAASSSTFGNNDILVTQPDGSTLNATYVSVDTAGDGTPRTVTYSIPAPTGSLATSGTGIYTVAVQAGSVTDTSGNAIAATALGTFDLNIPPSIAAPASAVADVNQALVFSAANGNSVTIADSDANGGIERLTLSCTNGTVALGTTSGITIFAGANASANITITGTVANLNGALNGLVYTPTSGFSGSASLSIGINDQGNSGLGGQQTAALSLPITVAAPISATWSPPTSFTWGQQTIKFSVTYSDSLGVSVASLGNDDIVVTQPDNTKVNATLVSVDTASDGTPRTATYSIPAPASGFSNGYGTYSAAVRAGAVTDIFDNGIAAVSLGSFHINIPPYIDYSLDANLYINEVVKFNNTPGRSISLGDADVGAGITQLSLSDANGSISLPAGSGLTFISGTNNSSSIVVTGTLSSLSQALGQMVFTPSLNYSGPAPLTITINDLGDTGLGGPQSDTATFNFTVHQGPASAKLDFGTANSPVAAGFTPISPVTSYSYHMAGGGWLNPANVFSYDTAIGTALTEDFNYTKNGSFRVDMQPGTYDVTFQLGDTRNYAHTGMQIYLQGQLVTPTPISTAAGQILSVTFHQIVVGGDTSLEADFLDSGDYVVIESMVVSATTAASPPNALADFYSTPENQSLNVAANLGVLANDTDPNGRSLVAELVSGPGHGSLTLNSDGSFAYTPNAGFFGSDSFTYQADDGLAVSAATTVALTVNQVNQPPTVSAPASVAANGTLAFTGGNAISVADVDSGGNAEQLTLSATHGTLSLASMPGLTFVSGSSGSASMVVTGTISSLNAALAALSFSPAAGYSGAASVALTINDLGNTGLGGPQTASAAIAITVQALPTSGQFDFGTSSSPVGSGFTQVSDQTTYSAALGYGWTAGTVLSYDTGIGTDVTRDFNYTQNATFEVDLQPGSYNVSLQLGDTRAYAHGGMQVYLQGQLATLSPISTAAGQVQSYTFYQVTVGSSDQLLVQLSDASDVVVIESLAIGAGTAAPPPPALPTSGQFDFGTSSSPVGGGFTQVSDQTTYIASLGYGWTAGTVLSYDTGIGTDVTRDFNYTQSATFEVDLQPGSYNVSLQLGDTRAYAHGGMQVYLQGQLATLSPISTAAGQVQSYTFYQVTVGTSDKLLVQLVDTSDVVVIESLAIGAGTAAPPPPPLATSGQFDFGTSSSPVGNGFTQISDQTLYSPALGYGWTAGTILSYDTGIGTDVTGDFNYTQSGTFEVDLQPGSYNVSLQLGDTRAYAHGGMQVYLQGQLATLSPISTAAGQVLSVTFDQIAVGADNELTLHLVDTSDAVVIESLVVQPAT